MRRENRHTRPDIDRLIKTVTEIVAGANSCKEEDQKHAIFNVRLESRIKSLGIGNMVELETLRNSNHL
jgi:hypothetical protein